MLNPDIFKRYDIRGKFPKDIDENKMRILIDAYVKVFNPEKVVVGHDTIEGSKSLYAPVCDQFLRNGVKVYKVGEVTSPMLYFASSHYEISQGLMLTASHLGVGYTGLKNVIDGIPPEPKYIVEMSEVTKDITSPLEGEINFDDEIVVSDIYVEYINKIKSLIPPLKNPERYNFVFDVSNGANAHVIKDLADYLNLDYMLINEDIRERDLAHDTNPKIAKNREQLVEKVKEVEAEIGIIWDGDGDRAYFVDNEGVIIPPEFIGVMIGKHLIQNKFGTTMTIDVRGSSAVEKEIEVVGGNVMRIQAWHVPIKFEMQKDTNVVFGMETSGHYVFRDMNKADDGLLASLMFISAIDSHGEDIRELLVSFRSKYRIIEEINFHTEKKEDELVAEFKQKYSDAKITLIDGITVDYPNWRFNIRSSKTEPIIRLNISGSDPEAVDRNLTELKEQIGGTVLS